MAIAFHAFTFLAAGLDTTATTITMTLFYLAKYPDLQDRAARECAKLDLEQLASLEGLQAEIPFTHACIKEAMRLAPPGYLLTRMPLTDLQLGPYKIPKGVKVGFNIYALHYNPKYFPDPKRFRPDRFMAGDPEMDRRPPNTFLPFGLGARNCIGQRFAVLT